MVKKKRLFIILGILACLSGTVAYASSTASVTIPKSEAQKAVKAVCTARSTEGFAEEKSFEIVEEIDKKFPLRNIRFWRAVYKAKNNSRYETFTIDVFATMQKGEYDIRLTKKLRYSIEEKEELFQYKDGKLNRVNKERR